MDADESLDKVLNQIDEEESDASQDSNKNIMSIVKW